MSRYAKILLPLAVLGGGALLTFVMVASRSTVESERPADPLPVVEVVQVDAKTVTLDIRAQGTVEPATESDLVAEVAGRIVWVSPQHAAGGSFAKGDVVARIDARDYQIALEGARAALQRAESALENANATLARQRSMRERGISSQARLDEALHAQANAAAGQREARVAVERAELDLARTRIRAPFAGRVREKHVDLGQFVNRGQTIVRVYSVDYAEVRLPVLDADLAHLDLPSGFGQGEASDGPNVRLSARVAGNERSWTGRIVRSEGVRDARTRMLHVVARVDDPYGLQTEGQTPLPMGLYVEATIEGRNAEGVFEIPRSALRRDDHIHVVAPDGRLHVRPVTVLRSERDRSWIRGGIGTGERLVVSPLEIATDGMPVRVLGAIKSNARDRQEAVASGQEPVVPAPPAGVPSS